MQERCQALLAAAGYAQYEVSAYARPGAQCAHNLNYWRFGDYLGIGAGAHGKLTLGAEQAIRGAGSSSIRRDYLARRRQRRGDRRRRDRSTPARRPFDFMLNALRLVEGFALPTFEARTGLPRSAIAAPTRACAQERGWLDDRRRPRAADRTRAGASPTT